MDDDVHDDWEDDRPQGMSSTTKVILWVLGGLAAFTLLLVYIVMASCTALVSEVFENSDKWVTDGSYSPYRKLEVQDVDAFVAAEARAAGGGMAGGDRRRVVIKGRVTAVERTPPDVVQLTFRTPAGEARCRFLRSTRDDLADTKAGDTLVVGGVVDWINKNTVQIKECQLQESWLRQGRDPK